MNTISRMIAQIDLVDFMVGEPDLEEIFMHYYQITRMNVFIHELRQNRNSTIAWTDRADRHRRPVYLHISFDCR